jgi:hypothetical protein
MRPETGLLEVWVRKSGRSVSDLIAFDLRVTQVAQSGEQRTENPCGECSIHTLPTKILRAICSLRDARNYDDKMIQPG